MKDDLRLDVLRARYVRGLFSPRNLSLALREQA